MDERMIKFQESADYIKYRISEIPSIAIVLGSGLGKLADKIENPVVIPYGDIPNFKKSTAIGHKGLLWGDGGARKEREKRFSDVRIWTFIFQLSTK